MPPTSTRRTVSRGAVRAASRTGLSATTKKWLVVSSVLVLTLAIAGGLYAYMREDPQVAEVEALMDEARQFDVEDSSPEAQEQRRERWGELREAMEQLDDSQRQQLFAGFREEMEQRMLQEVERFNSLPPEEQVAYLDEQIDRMQERRAEWERRRQQQGDSDGPRRSREGGPSRGGPPPGDAPPPGPPPGNGPPPGPPPQAAGAPDRRPPSDPQARQERRQQFRREHISHTTPEQRAQMANYRERLRERMEERGIEPGRGFGRRF